MRRSLLNKLNTPKTLHQALVLFTLLLLPTAAWGQTTYQSSKYNNETSTKWGDWNISYENVISILGSETLQTGIENGILFVVEASKIGTATITLNRPDNPKGIGLISLEVGPKNGDFATVLSSAKIGDNDIKGLFVSSNLDNGNTLYTYEPATLTEWPEGNNIVVSFTYNNTKNDNESRLLKEAKVVTGSPYGLTVAGVEVTTANKDDVLNNGGKVKFTPTDNTASPATPATLTLDGAVITGTISWTKSAPLTIAINGTNSVTATGTYAIEGNNQDNTTLTIAKVSETGKCKLILSGSSVGSISGFKNSSDTYAGSGLVYYEDQAEHTATILSTLSGSGTPTDPYLIETPEDLKDFSFFVNKQIITNKYIKIANNIDCDGLEGFESIGSSYPFMGTLSGYGNTISNLTINSGLGFFGHISGGIVNDLNFYKLSVKGNSYATGGIASELSADGQIDNCTLTECTIACLDNQYSPEVGGIVARLSDSGSKISNCVVYNSTINASTIYTGGSGPIGYAGGIVASYSSGTITNCHVKDDSKIINVNADDGSTLKTGAIVGILQGQGTFTGNTYESTVTTKAKKQGDSDYTTKSGQTQRGIGDGDDVIGQVELADTKKVTVKFISSNGNVSWDAVESTYYKTSTIGTAQKDYYVLPGCNFTFSMKPKNGYKPRFSLSDNAIGVTANEIKEGGAYDHTEFTFTMPSDDLEVIWSYPIDLAADNITATIDDANYTGEAIVPTTVKVIGAPGSVGSTPSQLTKDTDFTIKGYKLNGESVDSPVDIGTYTVTIEGTGNYIGTQDVSYEIIKAYALKINGTQLNAKNIDDFYGNGRVKFTPATETEPTNTLTLNGASVTGTIESGLGNLTIKLIGSNTIQGNGSSLITSLNGGTLTFDSDGTTISSLEFKDALGNVFPNDPISEFAEVKYGWFEYVESEGSKKVCSWDIEIIKNERSYRIYDGNKDHILGEGDESVKYSHDATNGHVITLNNAEVNCIWTDIHADITIALNGTNRVIDTGRTYAIYSNNGKINFVKAEEATKAELTATCRNGYVPIEYGSITLGEGLYWKPFYADANATVKSTVITDDPEFIIIEDYVMTDDRSIGTATSGITYNSTEKILTFNQYAGDLTSQIKTGVQGLTIKLKGTSRVAAGSLDYPFKALTNTASILFDGENDSETGSLVMDTNSDSAPFEGFAEGAITYNKVVYSRDDGNNNIHTIKAPTAPTMSLDNGKVKLTKDYDDGTIYYSIAYADDTPSETGVKYTEPFAITHPGVVTAWVEANNATTSTVTGKHFAYQDAPYTMAINGIKTPTLLPTIAEGDVISLQRYASEDEDIASFIDGLITAKKPGTVTLSAILMPGDNTPFKVLNPVSDPNAPNEHTVSFSVYVGENLSNYFEGSNEFGTFYNEDSEIYAVPQGMKAYVVTGVSGSKLVTVETTVLPPNTVVLLEKGSAISFTKVPAEGAAPGGNLLKNATADISVTTESSLYVLYNDTYVKATAGSPIPTGKNYLDLSTSTNAGTRGFYDIGGANDGTSALRGVVAEGTNGKSDAWYTLQGRRLSAKPTKSGLYLHNGAKVVVK